MCTAAHVYIAPDLGHMLRSTSLHSAPPRREGGNEGQGLEEMILGLRLCYKLERKPWFRPRERNWLVGPGEPGRVGGGDQTAGNDEKVPLIPAFFPSTWRLAHLPGPPLKVSEALVSEEQSTKEAK